MELTTIRQYLPRKWVNIIHEKLSHRFSPVYIRKVVYGERNNHVILDAAINLAYQNKQVIEEHKHKINLLH